MKTAAVPLLCLFALATSLSAQTPPATTQAAPPWPDNNTQATAEQLKAKGKYLRGELRNLTGSSKINAELLEKRLDDIVLQLDHNELQLTETRARLQSIVSKIRDLSATGDDAAARDPVSLQLQKVTDIQDNAAKRAHDQAVAGVSSHGEFDAAVAAAAESHVKLEERREAVAASVGGGILPALNRQLVELSLQEDVLRQMQRALEEKRDRLQEADRITLEILDVSTLLAARFHQTIDGE